MTEATPRVVVIATKPPWPAVGGGNVTLDALIRALVAEGAAVRVIALGTGSDPAGPAPYPLEIVPARPRGWLASAAGLVIGAPASLRRFEVPALGTAVAAALDREPADVVHLEQLHLAWLIPSLRRRAAVVLREQNVESVLLARLAAVSRFPLRLALRREAARVRRVERLACEGADAVAAISTVDAASLSALAPHAWVEVLPAAWPLRPARSGAPLAGSPAFVCLGSFDWRPNRDGVAWMLARVWPRIRSARPGAVLHLAGPGSDSLRIPACGGIVRHGVVDDVAGLLDPAAVLLVPVRAGSGVRLRLLEAWQAGLAAVTTPVGAEGLADAAGDGALIAADAEGFAAAAVRLSEDGALRRTLVTRGRERLEAHGGQAAAETALAIYRGALERARARVSGSV